MAVEEDRGFPVIVHVLATAKVTEVIGYACWKYTEEGRQPPLARKSHEQYTLYMGKRATRSSIHKALIFGVAQFGLESCEH